MIDCLKLSDSKDNIRNWFKSVIPRKPSLFCAFLELLTAEACKEQQR